MRRLGTFGPKFQKRSWIIDFSISIIINKNSRWELHEVRYFCSGHNTHACLEKKQNRELIDRASR